MAIGGLITLAIAGYKHRERIRGLFRDVRSHFEGSSPHANGEGESAQPEEPSFLDRASESVLEAARYGEMYRAPMLERQNMAGLDIVEEIRILADKLGFKERENSDLDHQASQLAGVIYNIHECFERK